MIGSSIYLRDRAAFTGGSPQAVFEELWERERKSRLRTRGIIAAVALIVGGYVVSPLFGVAAALVAAAADWLVQWRRYAASGIWRRGLRGEERMSRLLRFTLERRGYRVLHGRTVPGSGTADQLLIGPSGVWLIDNQAWPPDTELIAYGDRLFVDDRTPSAMVKRITGTAATVSRLLSDRLDTKVTVTPLLAVHGGKLRRGALTADGITLLKPWRLLRWPGRNATADYTAEEVETLLRTAVYALPIGGRTMTRAT
jgi:nuclease-like protein